MDSLKFGTDGWRDIIGERFTFDNVARAAQAYAEHLKDKGQSLAVVGYDTRFNGERFAKHVAQTLAANGLEVKLSGAFLPTPALSFAVKYYGAGGGVMLTASHNPPPYSGFKLKGPYGGTATQDIYADVSERVSDIGLENVASFDPAQHSVEIFDIRTPYYDALKKIVNLDTLRTLDAEIIHEAMGGSGTGWLVGFFEHVGLNLNVKDLHPAADPMFYGVNPEPIDSNLGAAIEYMKDESKGIVIATDGDADRLGAVLPGGIFFNSHQIFAVLLDQLVSSGFTGKVVKTFTVSRVIERLAKARGLAIIETPVGFKYIVDAMLEGDVLIGGEESGGIGVAQHIPERDGIANGLLLLEAMARTGKSVAELFSELEEEVGWRHAYDRLDLHLDGNELKDTVMNALSEPLDEIAGRRIESVERLDGVKLNLSDNAWLMFRASGTEPVLRIYCEASSGGAVQGILAEAEEFVKNI